MTLQDILAIRLANQQLSGIKFTNPQDLVRWFGAVQSQDFPGAKWALGQRLGLLNHDIEQAFNSGSILRTHVMRPTWHFVHPDDIIWMQKLTSTRVMRIMNYYNKKLGLDSKLFLKTSKIIERELKGKNFLTRLEIKELLIKKGVTSTTQTMGHIVSQAELEGLICSGPVRDKHFTYALISEMAPGATELTRDDSIKELTKRYFQSHGPATIKDFVWWSGMTTSDARIGIELNKLKSEFVEGKTYFFFPSPTTNYLLPTTLYLLPNYDEYTIAYQDRDAFLSPHTATYFKDQGNAAFWNAIVYKGEIVGMWKRTINKTVKLQTKFFNKLSQDEEKEFKKSVEKYSKFLGMSVETN